MNALRTPKKSSLHRYFSGIDIARLNPNSRLAKFPENLLVIGAGDESGTWILVVVV
jgi:hypothetical protein